MNGKTSLEAEVAMPPVIFLDIDGVMNSGRNMHAQGGKALPFDREAVRALEKILVETNARIVISSTWRINRTIDQLNQIFEQEGLPDWIVDTTPLYVDENDKITTKSGVTLYRADARGKEICAYLEKNPDAANYVVIDDDSDMDGVDQTRFFQTDFMQGLTLAMAEEIIERLR
jgi:hypothetical protein